MGRWPCEGGEGRLRGAAASSTCEKTPRSVGPGLPAAPQPPGTSPWACEGLCSTSLPFFHSSKPTCSVPCLLSPLKTAVAISLATGQHPTQAGQVPVGRAWTRRPPGPQARVLPFQPSPALAQPLKWSQGLDLPCPPVQ